MSTHKAKRGQYTSTGTTAMYKWCGGDDDDGRENNVIRPRQYKDSTFHIKE